MPRAVVEQATLNHISIVKDVVEQHYRNRSQTDEHMLKYMEEQWLATEANLTQERGLWGPFNENPLTKWQVGAVTAVNTRLLKLTLITVQSSC